MTRGEMRYRRRYTTATRRTSELTSSGKNLRTRKTERNLHRKLNFRKPTAMLLFIIRRS